MPDLSVAILMPTLNAERYLEGCLRSIREQDYPPDLVQIILADGGSKDRTIEIARGFGVKQIVPNPGVTTEAGLAVLNRIAEADLIAYIDADNFMVGRDWLSRMVAPFTDPEIFAAEPIRWFYDPKDPPLNRYFALSGINDPVSLFLGNYARHSTLTGRWTDMPHHEESRDGYLLVELQPGAVPVLGHNGFVARTEIIQKVTRGEYFFDVDAVVELVDMGYTKIAKVDVPIGHHFSRDLRAFRRKTRRRIEDFNYYRNERTYPWLKMGFRGYAKFVVWTATVLPLVAQSLKGFIRTKDVAWFQHIPACWLTLVLYVYGTIASRLTKKPYSRSNYRY